MLDISMKVGYDAKRLFYNSTGLGQYARDLIRSIKTYYGEIDVVLLTQLNKESNYSQEFLSYHSEAKSYPLFWRSWGISQTIQDQKLDIYHGLSNELPFNINRTGVPSVVTIHDVIFKRHPNLYPIIDSAIYDFKTKKAVQNAQKIIAISQQTKSDLMHYYKVQEEKIDVIYQDCSTSFSTAISDDILQGVKSKYQLPSNYILTVGRLEARKNLLLVADSLRLLPEDIHWLCIGRDHGEKKKILSFLSKNNLSHRVIFLENIPQMDLVGIYKMANAFIYTSLFEGFGIPILEAIRARVPVVTCKHSSLVEVAGPNGLYIEAMTAEALADKIQLVLTDHAFTKRLLIYQDERAQFFSSKKMAEETISVYQKLL